MGDILAIIEAPIDLEVLYDGADDVVITFAVPPNETPAKLTPAECAVLVELLAGRSNQEIASMRGTRRSTVANQVARVFEKLGVRSRLELFTSMPMSR